MLQEQQIKQLKRIKKSATEQQLSCEDLKAFNIIMQQADIMSFGEETQLAYALLCSGMPDVEIASSIDKELQSSLSHFIETLLAELASQSQRTTSQFMLAPSLELHSKPEDGQAAAEPYIDSEGEYEGEDDEAYTAAEKALEAAILRGNLRELRNLFSADPQLVSPNTFFNSGFSAIILAWTTEGAEDIYAFLMAQSPEPYMDLVTEPVTPPTEPDAVKELKQLEGLNLVTFAIQEKIDFLASDLLKHCTGSLRKSDIKKLQTICGNETQDDVGDEVGCDFAALEATRAAARQAAQQQAALEELRRQQQLRLIAGMRKLIPHHDTLPNDVLDAYIHRSGLFQNGLDKGVIILPTHAMPAKIEEAWLLSIANGEKTTLHVQTHYSAVGDLGSVELEHPADILIIPLCIHSTHYGLLVLKVEDKKISSITYIDSKANFFGTRQSYQDNILPHLQALHCPSEPTLVFMSQVDNEVECGIYLIAVLESLLKRDPSLLDNLVLFSSKFLTYETAFTIRCDMSKVLGLGYFKNTHGEDEAEARFADVCERAANISTDELLSDCPPQIAMYIQRRLLEEQQQIAEQRQLEEFFAQQRDQQAKTREHESDKDSKANANKGGHSDKRRRTSSSPPAPSGP